MGLHVSRYRTENGKTRKVRETAGKPAGKNGTPGSNAGAGGKNNPPGTPAKEGA